MQSRTRPFSSPLPPAVTAANSRQASGPPDLCRVKAAPITPNFTTPIPQVTVKCPLNVVKPRQSKHTCQRPRGPGRCFFAGSPAPQPSHQGAGSGDGCRGQVRHRSCTFKRGRMQRYGQKQVLYSLVVHIQKPCVAILCSKGKGLRLSRSSVTDHSLGPTLQLTQPKDHQLGSKNRSQLNKLTGIYEAERN